MTNLGPRKVSLSTFPLKKQLSNSGLLEIHRFKNTHTHTPQHFRVLAFWRGKDQKFRPEKATIFERSKERCAKTCQKFSQLLRTSVTLVTDVTTTSTGGTDVATIPWTLQPANSKVHSG